MDLSEVKKFEANTGTLKLSEAIRIGARIRPQCDGALFRAGKSCALGAAYEGTTGKTCAGHEYSLVTRAHPVLDDRDAGFNSLGAKIAQMNDGGRTREQIADWLEAQGL